MSQSEGQFKAPANEGANEEQQPTSPTEKIEGEPPAGTTAPGREKPESEVHNEINPNTE
ncbi:MAG TPA: hypothetical protein VFX96_18835 [Pyrinomonadaceae bacterium]|nr:hypothetical protein [Pyrinomonadaceae bacterium]